LEDDLFVTCLSIDIRARTTSRSAVLRSKPLWLGLQYLDIMAAMWKIFKLPPQSPPYGQPKIWVKISPESRGFPAEFVKRASAADMI
jgi:hypothetical protein